MGNGKRRGHAALLEGCRRRRQPVPLPATFQYRSRLKARADVNEPRPHCGVCSVSPLLSPKSGAPATAPASPSWGQAFSVSTGDRSGHTKTRPRSHVHWESHIILNFHNTGFQKWRFDVRYGYARVSSKAQDCQAQAEALKRLAARRSTARSSRASPLIAGLSLPS
jgi:hypothetical protein